VHRWKREASGQPETTDSSVGDDSLLVAAVLKKDRKATAEFVARYADVLYSYVRSRLAPRYDQVEDLRLACLFVWLEVLSANACER
jgi:hypothetical protein